MLAKNAMVLGKVLTAIAFVSIQPAQAQTPLRLDNPFYSIYSILNKMFDRATDLDIQKMQGAVYTALSNLANGEELKWYNDQSGNHGAVEIVVTTTMGGEICRRFYASFYTGKKDRHFEAWGCYNERTQTWNISNK
jgi:surface antigen